MAIIFIKDIKSRLDRTLSYIGNKEKTENIQQIEQTIMEEHRYE